MVEDSQDDALLMVRELRRGGFEPTYKQVDTAEALSKELESQPWDVILADYTIPGFGGIKALQLLKDKGLDIPFIFVSGTITDEIATNAMRAGAHDYVLKSNLKRLAPAIERELRDAGERRKRKQAEEAMRESEQRYRLLFENMVNGFAYCRMLFEDGKPQDFIYLAVNSSFEQQTGLKDVDGKKVSEVIPGIRESDPELLERYGRVALTGEPEQFEVFVESMKMWFSISVYSPAREYFVAVFDVITQRKQDEEALRRAAGEWRTTFDSISDMVSVHDSDYKIARVNKAFADFFKMSPQEIIGRHCYEIIHGEKEANHDCSHQEGLTTKKPSRKEFFNPYLGIYMDVLCSPILDDKGEVTCTVHVARDITERKRTEAENQHLREKAEISSRLAAVGEMAAGIAHEINNPLTGVIGFSELLLTENLPPNIKEQLQIIADGSHRVKEIVRRMLTFARQTKPMKTANNVNELIDNTLVIRSYVLRTANIEVIRNYDPSLPWVSVDPGQLRQVFLNLIVNAEFEMKKAHDKGTLTITTEKKNGHIRISFRDDGRGMSPAIMKKLFSPFFTTKDPGEGTGLGLSLSRSIILEHGGSIEVESEPGQGANFIITLPITPTTEETIPETTADIAVPPEKVRAARILVVDDEEAIRSLLSKILVTRGHTVNTTGKPEEALLKLANTSYDVVLLDIRMPGMSGMELYAKITEKHPEMARKVIFITGDTSDLNIRDYLKQHDLPYISKPFDREILIQKVNSLL